MKQTLKIIGSVICCIISIAVVAVFVYIATLTPVADEPELYQISGNTFLNMVYRFLTNGIDLNPLLLVAGLIALLVEILFSNPFHFLFAQFPLGHILNSERQLTVKGRVIPALLIGVASAVDNTYNLVSPESFAQNAVWINWAMLAVIAISFLVQFGVLLSQGGIWRVLVSGSLLVVGNIGCGALLGTIASMLCTLVAGLAMGFGILLLGLVVLFILSASTS